MNLLPLSFGQRQTEKILKEDALINILQNIIIKKEIYCPFSSNVFEFYLYIISLVH